MRKLGKGQAVIFCVPREIATKIMDVTRKTPSTRLDVSDVLHWAISETSTDLRRAMPLWAVQGRRFKHQSTLWTGSREQGKRQICQSQAEKFLENESLTLDHRYRPHAHDDEKPLVQTPNSLVCDDIENRCREFNGLQWTSASLQEEQERELAPEVEQERQIQKPGHATPATHHVHPDLVSFVTTGTLRASSKACMPAFEALKDTSAATHFDVSQFPKDLWVSCDFTRVIKSAGTKHVSDVYQRSVQWILVGCGGTSNDESDSIWRVVIISPYEAQELLPRIEQSQHVTLHLYSSRPNIGFRPLDGLDLYTTPTSRASGLIPRRIIMLLNLFAGQLYFDSYAEYIAVCDFLGVNWKPVEGDSNIDAYGFIVDSDQSMESKAEFQTSPLKFLKVHMTKVRRNGEGIDKTHIGKILGGALLYANDFETPAE